MAVYSKDQLDQYFRHIGFSDCPEEPEKHLLSFLTALKRCHLTRIPFETLELHYSPTREISIDRQDIFNKFITKGRGGWCFEHNTFFLEILRSLGFKVMAVACRMRDRAEPDDDVSRWRAVSHMAIIVTDVHNNKERYLVDVGCGAENPFCPIPLSTPSPGVTGITNQQMRVVQSEMLSPNSDQCPPIWIYSTSKSDDEQPEWKEVYAFADAEYLPCDYDVLNYYTMKASPFLRIIMAQRFFYIEKEGGEVESGLISLVRDQIKRKFAGQDMVIATFQTEEERIAAFVHYFDIHLADEETSAIQASAVRLP